MHRTLSRLALALTLLVPAAVAQWTANPGLNTAISTAAGDQSQPKVVPAPDGSFYLAWFDGLASGWDVRLQRLDAYGVKQWGANGVLVADRGYSSTQDYGLDVDAGGNALLTFRDDSGASDQIAASKVLADGTLAWGPTPVLLTATAGFVAAPSICGTTDGGAIVSWTEDSSTRVQKLDANGAPLWGAGLTWTPGAGSYSVCDSHEAGAGAIISFVHQTGGFGSPRHLYAQKVDGSGGLLWGANHLAVFDGGSLQFGNFPDFRPDGSGGAVFSWYDAATSLLNVYAQRVLSNGTEAFPHNGAAGSLSTLRVRVSPSADYDPATGETFMFWTEQNLTQSVSGCFGQKFDAAGVRQWGNNGTFIFPLASTSITGVNTQVHQGGAFVFWVNAVTNNFDLACAGRMNGNGTVDMGAYDASTVVSNKSRLVVARNSAGNQVLGWVDDRSDAGDIYVQNVDCDGDFGPSSWSALGFAKPGSVGTPKLTVDGTLSLGCPLAVHLADAAPGALAYIVVGLADVNLPFYGGTLVPAFEAPFGTFLPLLTGPDGKLPITAPWPGGVPGGTELFLQYWIVDPPAFAGFSASNASMGTVP